MRLAIIQTFHIIAKNTGLRKNFLRPQILHTLLKHAAFICEDSDMSKKAYLIKEETIHLLCMLCTVKTNRFYIPGETKMVENLKKIAFDNGLFTTLTYIYKSLDTNDSYKEMKTLIREKVLNLIELSDLVYHT